MGSFTRGDTSGPFRCINTTLVAEWRIDCRGRRSTESRWKAMVFVQVRDDGNMARIVVVKRQHWLDLAYTMVGGCTSTTF